MIPSHVLRAVDERLALNALADARLSATTRLMVDMVRAGICGGPAVDRRGYAESVQTVADFTPDHATSEPLDDLAYYLRVADESLESKQHCAQGLGAAWRAGYPFRRGREGDPYGVFLPQASDAEAVWALDQARKLSKPTPKALHNIARESKTLGRRIAKCKAVGGNWTRCAPGPYDAAFARALLANALEAATELYTLRPSMDPQMRGNVVRLRSLVIEMRDWVRRGAVAYDEGLFHTYTNIAMSGDMSERSRERAAGYADSDDPHDMADTVMWSRAAALFDEVESAIYYVQAYNKTLDNLDAVERAIAVGQTAVIDHREAALARLSDERDYIRALLPQLDEEVK